MVMLGEDHWRRKIQPVLRDLLKYFVLLFLKGSRYILLLWSAN